MKDQEPMAYGVWCPPGYKYEWKFCKDMNEAFDEMDQFNMDCEEKGIEFRSSIFPLYNRI